uniref:Uncharacterized protein n=1 Tax=Panagrolaimus davidi TaxID=227884 RepID=A0A914PR17_9BILA
MSSSSAGAPAASEAQPQQQQQPQPSTSAANSSLNVQVSNQGPGGAMMSPVSIGFSDCKGRDCDVGSVKGYTKIK